MSFQVVGFGEVEVRFVCFQLEFGTDVVNELDGGYCFCSMCKDQISLFFNICLYTDFVLEIGRLSSVVVGQLSLRLRVLIGGVW